MADFQSHATASLANLSGSGTVAKPSGTVSGDLLAGMLFATNTPASVNMAGFTIQATSLTNIWFVYKVAGGSEPASYTFGRGGANAGVMGCVIARYSGSYDAASPVTVYDAAFNNSSLNTVAAPSLAVPANASKLATIYAQTGNTARTFTVPTGMTQRLATDRTDARYSVGIADEDVSAGASGTRTWTSTNNGTNSTIIWSINPAASSGTGVATGTTAWAGSAAGGPPLGPDAETLAQVRAAILTRDTTRVDIGMFGASVVEGYPAPPGLWTETQLAEKLRAKYPTTGLADAGGYGYVGIPSLGLENTATTPIAVTGGAFNETLGWGGHHRVWFATAVQTSIGLTFTLPDDASSVVIETVGGSTGAADAGRYRINGGTWVAFNTLAGSASTILVTVPGPLSAGDVIEVGHNTTGTGNVVVAGFRVYNGDETKGIQVHNHGHYGYRIQDWNVARSAADPVWFSTLVDYDLLIFSDWGGNDGGGPGNLSAADFQTAFAELIDWMRTNGYAGDILIASLYNIEAARTFVDPWSEYVDAMRVVAGQQDAAFLQLDQYMPASPNAIYAADGVHGNADGSAYDLLSDLLLDRVVPPAGAGSGGTVAWSGTASGTAPEVPPADGSATGAVAYVGAATGTAPILAPNQGTATGALTFTGTAVGDAPLLPPGEGTATGAWSFTGTSAGTTDRSGDATGTWSTVGSAVGVAPLIGVNDGFATGSTDWNGTAVGHREPEGTAAGTTTWAGAATGDEPENRGTATGHTILVGAAVGYRSPKATGVAGVAAWTGAATGRKQPLATTAGVTAWTGTGVGRTPNEGTAVGELAWVGTAGGSSVPTRDVTVTAVLQRTRVVAITERERAVTTAERTRTVTIVERD